MFFTLIDKILSGELLSARRRSSRITQDGRNSSGSSMTWR